MKGFSVCLDYGHGGRDPGGVYKGRRESVDNLKIGKMLAVKLREEGIIVKETRLEDSYHSLGERVRIANEANYNYFISFHRNAFKPQKANGIEAYIHPKASKKAKTLGSKLLESLERVGFRNRGLKRKGFYVLKHTKSPAILIELGFIDNDLDNSIFDNNIEEIVEVIAREILKEARKI